MLNKIRGLLGLYEDHGQRAGLANKGVKRHREEEEEVDLDGGEGAGPRKRIRSTMDPSETVMAGSTEGDTSIVARIFSPITSLLGGIRTRISRHPIQSDILEESELRLRSRTKESLNAEIVFAGETIQASPPTRLEKSRDEVHLRKVANPNQPSSQIDTFRFLPSHESTAAVGSRQQQQQQAGRSFRLVTARERELTRLRSRPANLTTSLKAGYRPVYDKFFTHPHKKLELTKNAIRHCFNLEDWERYRSVLAEKHRIIYPSRLGTGTPHSRGSRRVYGNGAITVERVAADTELRSSQATTTTTTTVTDEVDAEAAASCSTPRPDRSGVQVITPPSTLILKKTSPPQKKESSLEAEYKLLDIYSPDFVKNLKAKYSSERRERDRLIAKEQAKKEYYERKTEESYRDVAARIERYLSITSADVAEFPPGEEEEEEEAEAEVEALPDISPEMEEVIHKAVRSRPDQTLVTAYRIPIAGKDIRTLQGLNWLNDEVINFYMQMIVARGGKDGYQKVYAFNTFFYPKLTETGYDSVKRWTKSVDIFSHDLLIVPVHLGMHWCLATIDIKERIINYYDSMGGNNHQCTEVLHKYMKAEHAAKKGSPLTEEFRMEIVKNIPRQMNGSDCGMFACKFAEYLSRRAKITFSQENMPYFRKRMIWEIVKNTILKP